MKTLLLIEDNKDMRENIAEILDLSGYKVLSAKNGKVGVDIAKKEIPDLIICDIMMPELDGYGVLNMLSKNEDTANIPFIFLTAKAEKNDFRKGMNLGADDYITKPFNDDELLKAIETRLNKHEILKKEFSKDREGLHLFMDEAGRMNDLKELSINRDIRNFKKKEYIFLSGNFPHALYFINKGKVKTYKSNDDGKELITGLYKEGDFIGYTALLQETAYAETAVALEDTEVSIIPKQDFFSLIYNNRDVAKKFIKMLSNNLTEKEDELVKLAYNSVRKRVADGLLLLQKKYQEKGDKDFSLAISRDNLANIVGTSTETLIRTLSDFKDEKLVDVKGGSVTIINVEKLSKMKN